MPQVKVLADDRAEWEGKVFVSEPLSPLPPMATTSCIMEDRGKPTNTNFTGLRYCLRKVIYPETWIEIAFLTLLQDPF